MQLGFTRGVCASNVTSHHWGASSLPSGRGSTLPACTTPHAHFCPVGLPGASPALSPHWLLSKVQSPPHSPQQKHAAGRTLTHSASLPALRSEPAPTSSLTTESLGAWSTFYFPEAPEYLCVSPMLLYSFSYIVLCCFHDPGLSFQVRQ